MTIYEYLANTSKNKLFEKSFIRWYQMKYGTANVKKKSDEWEKIYSSFLSESEVKPFKPSLPSFTQKEFATPSETTNAKGDK